MSCIYNPSIHKNLGKLFIESVEVETKETESPVIPEAIKTSLQQQLERAKENAEKTVPDVSV